MVLNIIEPIRAKILNLETKQATEIHVPERLMYSWPRWTGTDQLVACVGDASYAIEVPTYGLDGLAETIAIVKKPIHLHLDEEEAQPSLDEDLGLPAEEPAPPPLR